MALPQLTGVVAEIVHIEAAPELRAQLAQQHHIAETPTASNLSAAAPSQNKGEGKGA